MASGNIEAAKLEQARRRPLRKPKSAVLKEQMERIEAGLAVKDDRKLGLRIAHSQLKGRGIKVWILFEDIRFIYLFDLKSTKPFCKGEFVMEYVGNLIDMKTAKVLEAKYSMDTTTGCYMYYFRTQDKQYW